MPTEDPFQVHLGHIPTASSHKEACSPLHEELYRLGAPPRSTACVLRVYFSLENGLFERRLVDTGPELTLTVPCLLSISCPISASTEISISAPPCRVRMLQFVLWQGRNSELALPGGSSELVV